MKIGKKGLSEVIGYILLIVIAISISLLIYAWLRNYLPKEADKCPDSVSLSLEEYKCVDKTLELSLMNRGYFNLDGFIAKISNKTGYLPTLALSKISGPIVLGRGEIGFDFADVIKPDEKISSIVLNYSLHNEVIEIEIIPFMYEKGQQILCDSAALRQEIKNCVSEISGCISTEVPEATCDDNLDNDCDGKIDCVAGNEDLDCNCGSPVCSPANSICEIIITGAACDNSEYPCPAEGSSGTCNENSCIATPCHETSPYKYLCTSECIGNPTAIPAIPLTCYSYPTSRSCHTGVFVSGNEILTGISLAECRCFYIQNSVSSNALGTININGHGCTNLEVGLSGISGMQKVCCPP